MADAIANFTQEKGIEWLENDRQTMTSASAWPLDIYHLGIWTEEYMLGLVKHELKHGESQSPPICSQENMTSEALSR